MTTVQEILADERVKRASQAGRGGRVRDAEETAAASSVARVDDGREQASLGTGAGASSQNGASVDGKIADAALDGGATARDWIQNWREKRKVAAK